MAYMLEFDGQFDLTPPPSPEVLLQLVDLVHAHRRQRQDPTMPVSPNQWVLTRDRVRLTWDGGEKFYAYAEWLQWLIDHIFTPAGMTVTGTVRYGGEEDADVGLLTVENGVVREYPQPLINTDEGVDLSTFAAFVIQSRYGPTLLRAWYWQREMP